MCTVSWISCNRSKLREAQEVADLELGDAAKVAARQVLRRFLAELGLDPDPTLE